jgi:hypothetical protein
VNQALVGKFSIGLSALISDKDLEGILFRFHDVIHDVYDSPPYGVGYQSRDLMSPFDGSGAIERLQRQLKIVKNFGIKFKLALNSKYDEATSQVLQRVCEDFGVPDIVVALHSYIEDVRRFLPSTPIHYSYNNNSVRKSSNIDSIPSSISTVVVGNNGIRSRKLWRRLREKGFQVELLLNNGCSFGCGGCGNLSFDCKKYFDTNLQKFGAEYLYTQQSILPSEFYQYYVDEPLISYFKISSRPASAQQFHDSLESYKTGDEQRYLKTDQGNYFLWGRLAHFVPHYGEFSLRRILPYKKEIWEKVHQEEAQEWSNLCLQT